MFVYIVIILALSLLAYIYDYRGSIRDLKRLKAVRRKQAKNILEIRRRNLKKVDRQWKHEKKIFERLILLFMIMVVGLRYHIGSDTVVYEWNFNTSYTPYFNVFIHTWTDYIQPLWIFVMSFCKTYIESFVAIQFFHAIIYHYLVYRFIRVNTQRTFTALLLAFSLVWFANSFEVLRESITASIYLNALLFLKKKKFLPYILLGVIAMGFHTFSFVIFAITPLFVRLNYKSLITLFIVVFFGVRFIDPTLINNVLILVSNMTGDAVRDKMALYIGEKDTTVVSALGLIRTLVLDIFLPLIVLKYSSNKDVFYKKLVLLWMLFSCTNSIIPILYRMNNYLTIVYIVLLVNVLYNRSIKNIKLHYLAAFLTICLFIMGLWDVYRPSPIIETRANIHYDCRYFPYKTIFEDPDPIREGLDYY